MNLRTVLLTAALATAACGAKAPVAFVDNPLPLLVWLGEFTRPAGEQYPQMPAEPKFGSISGLAPDQKTKQWIGVIDDRERTRLAWLTVLYSEKEFAVTPTKMQELKAGPGVEPRIVTQADLEAIVALPNGNFVLSEEGHLVEETNEVWQPRLLMTTPDGVVSNAIDFPSEFHVSTDGKRGVRDNQGSEGLAITPSGRLIAGLEQPLIQDGEVTYDRPGPGRLVEFVRSGSTYKPGRQWRYMISPTPRVEGFDEMCGDGENGLVELLALSETTLIAMERACVMTSDKQFVANAVQLFSVELVAGDARKRLLVASDDLSTRLRTVLPRLENFEAMTFGPIVNGMKTLLIASDDNFRATQKTSFLLFGMK
jgi:hypothetical protein